MTREIYTYEVKYWTLEQAEAMPDWPSMEEEPMKETTGQPFHGEWYIEDQTRTDNGYALLRYCGVLPRIGWHNFGHYGDRESATMAIPIFRDQQADGQPWPDFGGSQRG